MTLKQLSLNSSATSQKQKEVLDILRLIRSENIGPRTFHDLMKYFGDAATALENVQEFSLRGGRSKAIVVCSEQKAIKELEMLNNLGANVITYNSPNYPKALLEISDFPPILSYKGDIELFNQKAIAIVGARNASANGRYFASKISKELIDAGYIVVSGLARGIDTAAHQACTSKTIAVIAGGIDHIYPTENSKLFEQISKEGLLVAELPVGSKPLAQHFPQRNRLISGLSLATIVIEASLKSGSLITARFALEQNREIFAVPGFPLDPRNEGTNKLIKEGAHLIESVQDVIDNIQNYENDKKLLADSAANCNNSRSLESKIKQIDSNARRQVLELLSNVPVSLNYLTEQLHLPLQVIYTILLELELAGKVYRTHGNKIALIYR